MPKPITKNQMADFWLERYAPKNHCMICGNSGRIDTRGQVFTAAGYECGGVAWCICPNGRAIERQVGFAK